MVVLYRVRIRIEVRVRDKFRFRKEIFGGVEGQGGGGVPGSCHLSGLSMDAVDGCLAFI